MRIFWPRFRFPPINLWNAPRQPALEDRMSETSPPYRAEPDDHVTAQLCARIDELERDKEMLAAQLDRAEIRAETLTGAVRKARLYAGEHLEARTGTAIVHMLEIALKEAS